MSKDVHPHKKELFNLYSQLNYSKYKHKYFSAEFTCSEKLDYWRQLKEVMV